MLSCVCVHIYELEQWLPPWNKCSKPAGWNHKHIQLHIHVSHLWHPSTQKHFHSVFTLHYLFNMMALLINIKGFWYNAPFFCISDFLHCCSRAQMERTSVFRQGLSVVIHIEPPFHDFSQAVYSTAICIDNLFRSHRLSISHILHPPSTVNETKTITQVRLLL